MASAPSRNQPPALVWAALLGLALFTPVALPAGGADSRLPGLRRRESSQEPLLNLLSCSLLASPKCEAPAVARLEPGMPMRILRTWLEPDGRRWLQIVAAGPTGRLSRGWLLGEVNHERTVGQR